MKDNALLWLLDARMMWCYVVPVAGVVLVKGYDLLLVLWILVRYRGRPRYWTGE
jgi:hypothetical protein